MRLRSTIVSLVTLLAVSLSTGAGAQTLPKPVRKGHPMRIKIDSAPQQAAIYIDRKEYGIEAYTPSTLKLPKGNYTVILELPGFKRVERQILVKKSEGFMFALEREARPAVLDLRSAGSDSASGGQLLVDGAAVGTVPGRIEVAAGRHIVEVKKAGFKDYRDNVDVTEGETRTLVIDLVPEAKKGALLVTADVAGAEVYVDGQRVDAAPTLVQGLLEGSHTVEVRKDGVPPWRQVVNVIGNQQTKVEARITENMPKSGSLRIVSSTPGAEVLVDGEPKGPANVEIKDLRAGQHIVEVRAQGFSPQVTEVNVVAGEQRLAKVDLVQLQAQIKPTMLRVVTPVPEADVFIDGASVGRAPIERSDMAPGKHFIVVRKQGFAEWKREIDLQDGGQMTVTADLSASGSLKVLANVPGANVFIDGQMVGKTPLTLDNVAVGDHLIEVKLAGHYDAKQPIRIDGGDAKVLSAELAVVQTGPSSSEIARRHRSSSSFSAVTLDTQKVTLDLAAGYMPFGQLRLTVGAWRHGKRALGIDAGIEARSSGYYSTGGAHVKFQFLRAGPVAFGTNLYLGGGGGPMGRNTFEFEYGLLLTLLFGDVVRFTIHPYVQAYTDRNCRNVESMKKIAVDEAKAENETSYARGENDACKVKDGLRTGDDTNTINGTDKLPTDAARSAQKFDPRNRDSGARLMLRAMLEIAVHHNVNIFFMIEGDPVGPRFSYSKKYSHALPDKDSQVYGRAGATIKF